MPKKQLAAAAPQHPRSEGVAEGERHKKSSKRSKKQPSNIIDRAPEVAPSEFRSSDQALPIPGLSALDGDGDGDDSDSPAKKEKSKAKKEKKGKRQDTQPEKQSKVKNDKTAKAGGGSSQDVAAGDDLVINKNFAQQFDEEQTRLAMSRKQNRQNQRVQRASLYDQLVKDVHGSDSAGESEEEESEDSDAEVLNSHLDSQINDLLWKLKSKDPSIYDPRAKFFSQPVAAADAKKSKKEKPLTLREGLAKQLLEGGTVDSDEEDEELRHRMMAPAQQREAVRRKVVSAIEAELGDDSDASESEIFMKRRGEDDGDSNMVDSEQVAREEKEYERWVNSQNRLRQKLKDKAQAGGAASSEDEDMDADLMPRTADQRSLEALNRYFKVEEQKKADMDFLRRYIFHEWWRKDPNDPTGRRRRGASQLPSATEILGEERVMELKKHIRNNPLLPEANSGSSGLLGAPGAASVASEWDSEDEEDHLDDVDMFERRHNFRFEEDGAGEHVSHARYQEESVRQTVSRRKKAREERRARLDEEKRLKAEQLKRLKGARRREIEAKMVEIAKIAGLPANFLQSAHHAESSSDDSSNSSSDDDDEEKENAEMKDDEEKPDISLDLEDFDEDELRRAKLLSEGLDLDADFDPDEHDRLMERVFDQQYYEGGDRDAEDHETISKLIGSELDEDEAAAAAKVAGARKQPKEQKAQQQEADDAQDVEVDDEAIEQRLDELLLAGRNSASSFSQPGQYMRQYRDKLKKILKAQQKRLKNHTESADGSKAMKQQKEELEQSVRELSESLEKLEELDFEDMIGGELRTRFKYRQVTPASFGMSVEEILDLPDRELNARVSLKQLSAYREDDRDFNWWDRRNNSRLGRRVASQKQQSGAAVGNDVLGKRRHEGDAPADSASADPPKKKTKRGTRAGKKSKKGGSAVADDE